LCSSYLTRYSRFVVIRMKTKLFVSMHYFSYILWQLCLLKVNNVFTYIFLQKKYVCIIVFIYAQSFYSFIFNKKSFIFVAGETKKSKINIGVHGYANWLGRGTILQGGDRNILLVEIWSSLKISLVLALLFDIGPCTF